MPTDRRAAARRANLRRFTLGTDDKISSAAGNLSGKAKEFAGKMTDDEGLWRQGRLDQAKSSAKDAVEDLKAAAKKTADMVKDAFKN